MAQAIRVNKPKVKPLSLKAVKSIYETGYLNVWEGAVRSAKTVASTISWMDYLEKSPESYFLMSGQTQSSLYRNVIGGDFGLLSLAGKDKAEYKTDQQGNKFVQYKTKRNGVKICYCFGANDSASFKAIRGLTIGGWYADEINMHHKSFVEEAFRRSIVSTDRKNFWTLNPDNPFHWIYTEYLDKYEEAQLPGFNIWKFTLDDNLAITEERKNELKAQYTGVFYKRYILGMRCLAESVIYSMFNEDKNIKKFNYDLRQWDELFVSCDYGTQNPCTFGLFGIKGSNMHEISSWYYDGRKASEDSGEYAQMTDQEYAEAMVEWLGDARTRISMVIVDPSAASFITELRKKKYGLPKVVPADNAVVDGIRTVMVWIKSGQFTVDPSCEDDIREFGVYSWDEKKALHGEDAPIKEFDHAMDKIRYAIYTRYGNYVPPLNPDLNRRGRTGKEQLRELRKKSKGVV